MAEPFIGPFGGPAHVHWPGVFAGRGTELAALRDAWRAARAGEPQVVVITAGPGIGKTALLGRFVAEHALERYVWVSGGEAFEEALEWQLLGQLAAGLAELTEHPASWADRNPLSNPAFAGLPLLDELRAAGPVAVIVDDVQWADQKSAEVLTESARSFAAAAAIVGAEFDVARAAQMVGLADAAPGLVDELTEAGLLEEVGASDGRRFRFSHALVRRAVYEQTPLARRRAVHLRAAELAGESTATALRHCVAATDGPDAVLAADLDVHAADVAARGELAAAARHWRESLRRCIQRPWETTEGLYRCGTVPGSHRTSLC